MANNYGYVYILTNKAFKSDWVKIGKTSKSVEERVASLDCTSIPTPFDIYATIKTKKFNELEKVIHHTFDNLTTLRIRSNREFFNIKPDDALTLIQDIALPLIDDAEVNVYADSTDNDVADSTTDQSVNADEKTLSKIKASLVALFASDKEKYANWHTPYFYHDKLIFSNRKNAISHSTAGNNLVLAIDINCIKGNEYINVFIRKDSRTISGINKHIDHSLLLPVFDKLGFTVQNTNRNHKGKLHLEMTDCSADDLKDMAVNVVEFIEDNLANMQKLIV